MAVEITRFEMAGPDDVGALTTLLRGMDAATITRLAVVAKVEGTATINDFSRALALRAIADCFARAGCSAQADALIIVSTGCEGIITPGGFLITESSAKGVGLAGLALGVARSEPLAPDQMINATHARIAARVTAAAITDAKLRPEDVALVLMKSPVLTRAEAVGLKPEHRAWANSTAGSRGIAALGVAAALGEIDMSDIDAGSLGRPDLYARRAMSFSGTETRRCEAIVLGNRPGSSQAIRTGVIADLLDIEGMAAIIAPDSPAPLATAMSMSRNGRIKAAFLKAGLASDGRVRGQRTTIDSSDLDPDKHLRAAASGALGALLGDTRCFVSGGAEHQAPPGGCVFAVVLAE